MHCLSQARAGEESPYVDYCFLRCMRARLTRPGNLIKATWIRPEDLQAYEDLGYSTFRILGYGLASKYLLQRVKAYSERHFKGNLAEILLPGGGGRPRHGSSFWALHYLLRPWQRKPLRGLRILEMAKEMGAIGPGKEMPIRIDSAAIPDYFLEGFRRRDCAKTDCQECDYCDWIAAGAVRIDPTFRKRYLDMYNKVEKEMAAGTLWPG